jgi:CrcB protein
MPLSGLVAVGVGAVLGAWLRWWLGATMNALLPSLPLGTLAANLIGGYLVGVAIAVFSLHPALDTQLKLFVITGFLGALTTFSTFSGEAVALLHREQYGWALAHMGSHLAGSLLLTVLGMLTVRAFHP